MSPRLLDAAPTLSVEEATRVIQRGLELASHFEARGLSWRPQPKDFALDDDRRLVLTANRGVAPLEYPARFDVEPLLIALGACLVPTPLALAPPSLVRLVLPHARSAQKTARSIDEVRRAVEGIDLRVPSGASESAALADIGLWRDHNDDVALTSSGGARASSPWHALILCDGVSSVPNAAAAASVAARAARDEIARGVASCADGRSIVMQATQSADLAVRKLATETRSAIGTTIVMALVKGDELAVAWVGDSRAYWVTGGGEEQLTVDHARDRQLTSCLGMVDVNGKAAPVTPDVISRTLAKKGALVLCSDGLWNHFPNASSVSRLVNYMQSTSKNSALLARFLVNSALAAGGADNVSVAVHVRGA